ncbi:MAG: VacJ family lipoprotein [Gammaproteobacteria bacterium]|nr:VacJ family lipoprotein [Gammaproteobacteria bacterium]
MQIKVLQRALPIIFALLLVSLGSGCASTQTKGAETNNDTLEPVNRASFGLNETLAKYIIKPIAEPYAKYTPEIYRSGITNFFDNLSYLNVVLHSFLQGKFGQGFSGITRFVVNSTLGIGGLNDIATPMGLEKHDEDLGQTLAVWGVGQGSYLVVPLNGPNTVRNAPDMVTSTLLNPFFYISSAILFPVSALNLINKRANLLEATNIRDEAAIEPYTFTREAYLQQRNNLIYDGNPPLEGYDDIFDDIEDSTSDSATLSIE